MKIGGLYKLNIKYDQTGGKNSYLIKDIENPNNYVPGGVGFVDPWTYGVYTFFQDQPLLLIEKDIYYSYIKEFKEISFVKLLIEGNLVAFPHGIYQPDILIVYNS